jgi:predicted RNA-binding protein with PUA-like domain
MAYWLVKEEPEKYPFSQLRVDRVTAWTGVRNFQARNNLRAMAKGDEVVYYHTGKERAAVGLAKVSRTAYPDPTAAEGDWSCVDLRAGKALAAPVDLATVKADTALAGCALVKQGRLSVVPLSADEFARIVELGSRKG